MRTRGVVTGVVAVVALTALSLLIFATSSDTWRGHRDVVGSGPPADSCTVPQLRGTVVHVTLVDMGGAMGGNGWMGNRGMMGGAYRSGMMRIVTDAAAVPHGKVSFVATNAGSIDHELLVLPLRAGETVGTRAVGDDGTVDETTSLGEASKNCGAGEGDGIAPGSASWLTLDLAPGRYELLCNIAGHYAAGMYAQLVVR